MSEQGNDQVGVAAPIEGTDPRAEVEAGVAETEPAAGVTALQARLDEAEREVSAAQDRYLRARADMENYKKRLERTSAENQQRVRKDLLRKVLAVRDNLERALQFGNAGEVNNESIVEGVRLTQYQLDSLLQSEGVQPIEAQGQAFDPRLEEALQSVNDPSVPDHTVIQVVRNGYVMGDEVLRPAQVIVSVHPED